MLRPYVSKSSIESHESCNLKGIFYYHLGKKDPPRKKTVLGTAAHLLAEILSLIKLEIQNGKVEGILETEIGKVDWTELEFTFPSLLTKEESDKINKSRANKKTYLGKCEVKTGQLRKGRDFINGLIERIWLKVSKETAQEISFWGQEWEPSDRKDLYNFCWLLLENFDPRFVTIIDVEKEFDLEIEHPDCLVDGKYIRVKGFIDLVYSTIPGVIQFVDYKTGERRDFNSGQEKTLKDLSLDLQLILYNYAIKKLYKATHIIGSICFIRDGGLFTPDFPDNSDAIIFEQIRSHIKELRDLTEITVLSENRDDFRCKYLCGASKRFSYSKEMCDCEFIKRQIRENGIKETIERFKV